MGIRKTKWSNYLQQIKIHGVGIRAHGNLGNSHWKDASPAGKCKGDIIKWLQCLLLGEEHGEVYATKLVRTTVGISLDEYAADAIGLPPHFRYRRLYEMYCYEHGYKIRNRLGNYGRIGEYPVRIDDEWPLGSEPLPVCSWGGF